MKYSLVVFLLATCVSASAADMDITVSDDGPVCTSANVVTDKHMTWDFMEDPEGTVKGIEGFRLSHMVRTILVNNPNALEQVLNVPFASNQVGAAVTGLARAACACVRAGNYDAADMMLSVRSELNGWVGRAFDNTWNACVSPTPVKVGKPTGYVNVSPTRIN